MWSRDDTDSRSSKTFPALKLNLTDPVWKRFCRAHTRCGSELVVISRAPQTCFFGSNPTIKEPGFTTYKRHTHTHPLFPPLSQKIFSDCFQSLCLSFHHFLPLFHLSVPLFGNCLLTRVVVQRIYSSSVDFGSGQTESRAFNLTGFNI